MLPKFARDLLVWRRLQRDPIFMKRMMGTVSVTSIGMAGHGGIGWGIPLGIHLCRGRWQLNSAIALYLGPLSTLIERVYDDNILI